MLPAMALAPDLRSLCEEAERLYELTASPLRARKAEVLGDVEDDFSDVLLRKQRDLLDACSNAPQLRIPMRVEATHHDRLRRLEAIEGTIGEPVEKSAAKRGMYDARALRELLDLTDNVRECCEEVLA